MRPNDQAGPDWVPTLLALAPDLVPALSRAGIRDDRTYLDREGELPRRIRARVAAARLDLTLIDRVEIGELAIRCPPWVREAPIEALSIPPELNSRLRGAGASRVSDLVGAPVAAELSGSDQGLVRLALYRAVRTGALRPEPRPEPPRDRVRSLLRLAPDELLQAPLSALPGLPIRVLRATQRGGIERVGDLAERSDANLKMLPYFGTKSLEDLLLVLGAAVEAARADRVPAQRPDPVA